MKRRHLWLLIATCLLVIALTLANFLASIHSRDTLHQSIQNVITTNDGVNEETIKRLVEQHVAQIEIPAPIAGSNGRDGVSVQGAKGDTGENGKDGKDGRAGRDGTPGIAREIELATDESGTLLYRYAGDDFWTVIELVEDLN